GMFAARAIYAGLRAGDASAAGLAEYDRLVKASFIMSDLYRTRNMRLAFKDGFYVGGVKAGLMTVTGGRVPGRKRAVEPDRRGERAQVQADVEPRTARAVWHRRISFDRAATVRSTSPPRPAPGSVSYHQ